MGRPMSKNFQDLEQEYPHNEGIRMMADRERKLSTHKPKKSRASEQLRAVRDSVPVEFCKQRPVFAVFMLFVVATACGVLPARVVSVLLYVFGYYFAAWWALFLVLIYFRGPTNGPYIKDYNRRQRLLHQMTYGERPSKK
jgi:hypothetical protein